MRYIFLSLESEKELIFKDFTYNVASGGSRYSAMGPHYVVDPDIPLGDNLICFTVSHIYFFVGGGPKSIAKLDGGPWPDLRLPTGSVTVCSKYCN